MTGSIKQRNHNTMTQENAEQVNHQILFEKSREASYVVLFVAAIFVINAMETGSYRTPWSVAIITAMAGFGLFGYSWYLQSRRQ